jgi:hypothetical protein
MKKLVIAAILLAAAPTVSFAKSGGSLDNVPYAIKARCDTLMQRFDAAAANPKPGVDLAAAKAAAQQGGALCRASHYEEGGDSLEKALKLIGASGN